jgi:ABC-2 type transport system permease protein
MSARRAVWEVARRELVQRSRSRALRVGLVILLALAVGGAVAAARIGSGTPADDVGLVGPRSAELAPALRLQARSADRRVRLHAFSTRAAASRAVKDGTVDVAVVDGRTLVVDRERSSAAVDQVQAAIRGQRVVASLRASGLSEREALAALSPRPLPVVVLEPQVSERTQGLLYAGVLGLFVALATFGNMVAYGVTEEKSSRVVELLLTTLSPRRLLAGKVLGIGLLGVTELVLVGGAALVAGRLAGGAGLPSAAPGTLALVVLWFVLGFAFYSVAYAAAGALVSRQEDLQSASAPVTWLMTAAFLTAYIALDDPDSTLVRILALLPPFAPILVPARVVLGDMGALEVVAAVALSLAGTAGLVLLAARVYERALLRIGAPVKVRQVLGRPRPTLGARPS